MMDKPPIEQLLSNGLSVKQIKSIVGQLDETEHEHDLNKTTLANACGLILNVGHVIRNFMKINLC